MALALAPGEARIGVAQLSDVTFSVPGAQASAAGLYNVLTKDVDLRGNVALEASLSEAAGGGLKSFFMRPINFLYKTKQAGAVLPVTLKGKYPTATLKASLKPAKHQ
jgi:hypothetical protein